MTKKDLKEVLKPLIKNCIKEVLLEEGILSNIVTEVVTGMQGAERIVESKNFKQNVSDNFKRSEPHDKKLKENKQKMLDAIGLDSYNGVNLFENTEPMRAQSAPGHSPLSSLDPKDPGVDLSSIPGSNYWSKLIK